MNLPKTLNTQILSSQFIRLNVDYIFLSITSFDPDLSGFLFFLSFFPTLFVHFLSGGGEGGGGQTCKKTQPPVE